MFPTPSLLRAVITAWLLLLPACEVNADMFGLFAKKYDVHLSPAVNGRVTNNGQPVAGLTLKRALKYGDLYTDEATTDNNGEFHFAERNIRSRLPGGAFTGDTKVIQSIMAIHQGQEYAIWYTSQIGLTPNQALTRRLLLLHCDLTVAEAKFYFKSMETDVLSHTVVSICRWPFGPKPNDLDDDWK